MADEPRYENLGKILQNLPKEKLSEDFDERFWKRFRARSGYRWMPAAAALLLVSLAVCMFAGNVFLEKPSAEIVQGEVTVQPASKEVSVRLTSKRLLNRGDRIKAAASGWAILELENGYQIKLNSGSEIILKKLKPRFLPGKTVVSLIRGQALVSIGGDRHVRYPFEIVTPNAFARAMGTQFMVSAPSELNPASGIRVLSGTVQAGQVSGGRSLDSGSVTAGKEIQISNLSKGLLARPMAEKVRAELEELFQFSKKNRAILLIGMGPNRVRDLLKPCAIYLRTQSSDDQVSGITDLVKDIQKAVEGDDRGRHLTAAENLEEIAEKQSELNPVPLLLFTGAYYSYLAEYKEAARVFGNISLKYPKSNYASLALIAEAVIQKEKLADPEKAKALVREILARYPESVDAAEASRL